MPHLILEYSANIAQPMRSEDIVGKGHAVMLESGLFQPASVKTRSHEATFFAVGEHGDENGFLHVLVYLMEGRSPEQKQTLSEALFAVFDPIVPHRASLTVDIRDLDKACYRKRFA